MRWTRVLGAAAGLMLLSGCFYAYGTRGIVTGYSASGRPVGDYYCYDCHGYRYFDPYYDWCEGYGFRFAWSRHPEAVAVYRQRYVRIKEQHPEYGRYRYPRGSRASRRYQEPRDYETWRRARLGDDGPEGRRERPAVRERDRGRNERPGVRDRRNGRDDRPDVREREDRKKKKKDGSQPPGKEKRRDQERGQKQRHRSWQGA